MNTLFDSVYVINMDKDTEKMRVMEKTLAGLNVTYTRFPAIDGREVSKKEKREMSFSICSDIMCTKGTIGCGMSHMSLWKQIAKNDVQSALILEDDVVFTKNAMDVLEKAMDQLPEDWDLLYLGILNTGFAMIDCTNKISTNLCVPSYAGGTHAYAVSNKGCRKLLQRIPKVSWHIDQLMSRQFKHLRVFACDPMIAYQRDMHTSNIGSKTPILLNHLTNVKIHENPLDGRTISWYLSEDGGKVGFDMFPINAWCGIFFIIGFFDIRLGCTLLGIDITYGVFNGYYTIHTYIYLLCSILMGYLVRKSLGV